MATKQNKERIQQLIKEQKEFLQEINEYTEESYWMDKTKYRENQMRLAKEIHNAAHKEYMSEYQSKSVIADVTAEGGWWHEKDKDNREQ